MNPIMNYMFYEACNQYFDEIARENTTEDTKRKIVFPDGSTIVFRYGDSDKIKMILNIIFGYIKNGDIEALGKIKKFYVSKIKDICGNDIEREIPNESEREKKAFESLKALKILMKNLQDEIPSNESMINKVVGEYVCGFLGIDNVFDKMPVVDESHRIEDKRQIDDEDCDIADEASRKVNHVREEAIESQNMLTAQPTTLFNNEDGEGAIEAGSVNLVYSARGVGKSYFALEVAKSPLVKNPLYIMLDDISDEQTPRIKHLRLQDKITLIDDKEWEKRYSEIKEKAVNKAQNQAQDEAWNQVIIEKSQELKLLSICLNTNRQVTKRKEEIMKSLGFEEKKVVSNIIVLESVLKEAVQANRDLIIIDSLQGLLPGHINHLTYDDIKKITRELIKNKITLILLHHENEQGKSKGSKAILDMFPYVYRLRANNEDDTKLYLDTKKARSRGKQTFILERTFEDKYFATHTIISVEKPHGSDAQDTGNLADKIKAILDTHIAPTISRESLEQKLRDAHVMWKSETSITNALTELAKKGIIKKADDKTWKVITILANTESKAKEDEVTEED